MEASSALLAQKHDMTVYVDASSGTPIIFYADDKGGKTGSIFLNAKKEAVRWICDKKMDCTNVYVQFKNQQSPCGTAYFPPKPGAKPPQTDYCSVGAMIGKYGYSIAVQYSSGIAVDDPDVIVDNGQFPPPDERRQPTNKKKQ
jgi:hypothetical protein